MRGALGVMAAAVTAVVVTAWRRVHRDDIEARLVRRAARRRHEAQATHFPRPPLGGARRARARPTPELADQKLRTATAGAGKREIEAPRVEPRPVRRSGAESPASIRIVRRSPEPTEPIPVTPRSAELPEPAAPRAPAPEPGPGESVRTEPPEPVRAEPPRPAEARGGGRAEHKGPPAAWDGGSAPLPAHVPRPMYWPAFLALGVVWAAWGSISTPLLIFGGIAVFAAAIALWIREMVHAV